MPELWGKAKFSTTELKSHLWEEKFSISNIFVNSNKFSYFSVRWKHIFISTEYPFSTLEWVQIQSNLRNKWAISDGMSQSKSNWLISRLNAHITGSKLNEHIPNLQNEKYVDIEKESIFVWAEMNLVFAKSDNIMNGHEHQKAIKIRLNSVDYSLKPISNWNFFSNYHSSDCIQWQNVVIYRHIEFRWFILRWSLNWWM